jgi:hypothetical protein
MYVAKTRVVLPFLDEVKDSADNIVRSGRVKEPGDRITKRELDDARQTKADVAALIKQGAIEEAS